MTMTINETPNLKEATKLTGTEMVMLQVVAGQEITRLRESQACWSPDDKRFGEIDEEIGHWNIIHSKLAIGALLS